ncbi:hypothetical protein AWRI1631_163990 [Saccharomyces cerevisiae AWRI1631]|uniref:Uncharacterized protein n=1 Tax=Saccharomyces cerevisiae (strain AWRI1631) TaxID=545124 RepID=B5VTT5_YEAS6|nr:hypothetical protein AWRI1631_163990 [Saccharomyces cerevisiae AWRI1631]
MYEESCYKIIFHMYMPNIYYLFHLFFAFVCQPHLQCLVKRLQLSHHIWGHVFPFRKIFHTHTGRRPPIEWQQLIGYGGIVLPCTVHAT